MRNVSYMRMFIDMTKEFIGTGEVAKRLNMPRATVAYQAARGVLPTVGKMSGNNGAYLFNPKDIEALASEEAKA